MNTIYMLVGAPGSGKTWVCNQIKDKYLVIENDAYIGQNYVAAIAEKAPRANKPVLVEAPFSMSQIIEPLADAGFNVIPVFIIESVGTHSARYEKREGKPIPKGHLTRTKTYFERALDGGHFYGTSEQVLGYLRAL